MPIAAACRTPDIAMLITNIGNNNTKNAKGSGCLCKNMDTNKKTKPKRI